MLACWNEIVGVVPDFPAFEKWEDGSPAVLDHAATAADVYPATLAVRVRGGDPIAFAGDGCAK